MALAASSGYTTPLFLAGLARRLLSAARHLQIVHGDLSLTGYVAAIRQIWTWTCALAQGHEVHLPVVVGLVNIEVIGRHPLDDTTILCGREPELHALATFVASGLRTPSAFLLLRQPFRLLERGARDDTFDDPEVKAEGGRPPRARGRAAGDPRRDGRCGKTPACAGTRS